MWAVFASLAFCFYFTSAEITALICGFVTTSAFFAACRFCCLEAAFWLAPHRNPSPMPSRYTLRMGRHFSLDDVVDGLVLIAMAVTSYNFLYTGADADDASRAMALLLVLA